MKHERWNQEMYWIKSSKTKDLGKCVAIWEEVLKVSKNDFWDNPGKDRGHSQEHSAKKKLLKIGWDVEFRSWVYRKLDFEKIFNFWEKIFKAGKKSVILQEG